MSNSLSTLKLTAEEQKIAVVAARLHAALKEKPRECEVRYEMWSGNLYNEWYSAYVSLEERTRRPYTFQALTLMFRDGQRAFSKTAYAHHLIAVTKNTPAEGHRFLYDGGSFEGIELGKNRWWEDGSSHPAPLKVITHPTPGTPRSAALVHLSDMTITDEEKQIAFEAMMTWRRKPSHPLVDISRLKLAKIDLTETSLLDPACRTLFEHPTFEAAFPCSFCQKGDIECLWNLATCPQCLCCQHVGLRCDYRPGLNSSTSATITVAQALRHLIDWHRQQFIRRSQGMQPLNGLILPAHSVPGSTNIDYQLTSDLLARSTLKRKFAQITTAGPQEGTSGDKGKRPRLINDSAEQEAMQPRLSHETHASAERMNILRRAEPLLTQHAVFTLPSMHDICNKVVHSLVLKIRAGESVDQISPFLALPSNLPRQYPSTPGWQMDPNASAASSATSKLRYIVGNHVETDIINCMKPDGIGAPSAASFGGKVLVSTGIQCPDNVESLAAQEPNTQPDPSAAEEPGSPSSSESSAHTSVVAVSGSAMPSQETGFQDVEMDAE
ncbi:hypothetical protein BXZ70DRAFT_911691 [Cristinia sonorae]|uniref:Uncharacterized protein n=1 Tax=Cristinia sonorae TaxID=1940300 RepID=A0A8K0UD62_9AGAR|nr:hypothetical protein BXZ70DRAFT_911691 [Cristinia sonorae]